jgi:hypothetical protein
MPPGSWAIASAPARVRLGAGGVNGQKVRHGWVKPGDLVVVARMSANGAIEPSRAASLSAYCCPRAAAPLPLSERLAIEDGHTRR